MNDYPNAVPEDGDLAPALTDGAEHAHTCWNTMLCEATKALQLGLEELAMLAGIATAAIDPAPGPQADPAPRATCSALLEPGQFRFRS